MSCIVLQIQLEAIEEVAVDFIEQSSLVKLHILSSVSLAMWNWQLIQRSSGLSGTHTKRGRRTGIDERGIQTVQGYRGIGTQGYRGIGGIVCLCTVFFKDPSFFADIIVQKAVKKAASMVAQRAAAMAESQAASKEDSAADQRVRYWEVLYDKNKSPSNSRLFKSQVKKVPRVSSFTLCYLL